MRNLEILGFIICVVKNQVTKINSTRFRIMLETFRDNIALILCNREYQVKYLKHIDHFSQ